MKNICIFIFLVNIIYISIYNNTYNIMLIVYTDIYIYMVYKFTNVCVKLCEKGY